MEISHLPTPGGSAWGPRGPGGWVAITSVPIPAVRNNRPPRDWIELHLDSAADLDRHSPLPNVRTLNAATGIAGSKQARIFTQLDASIAVSIQARD